VNILCFFQEGLLKSQVAEANKVFVSQETKCKEVAPMSTARLEEEEAPL
jgi:hypothetical protein